ncbi:MAG: hypothetical protein WD673_11325 [Alphaproteobacteria bacterium]
MKRGLALLAVFVLASVAGAEESDPMIAAIQKTGAAQFDPSLPTVFLEVWLRHTLPRGAEVTWETNDCGEQTGDPVLDAGREFPTCVGAHIDVPSRARGLELLFEPGTKAFILGAMTSPEALGDVYFEELGLLPAMLDQPLALRPLACLDGSEPVVETEFAGSFESCRKDSAPDGAYRSWFNTGLYLKERGDYAAGAKVGRWVECDRFERCQVVSY